MLPGKLDICPQNTETKSMFVTMYKCQLKVVSIGNDFLSRTQLIQQLKERINKWDYMKLESFYTTKEKLLKLKRPPTE
jgi:hypothetical protein